MAASLPTLDERTGERAGEYRSEYKPMDSFDQLQLLMLCRERTQCINLVGRQDLQQEVNVPQDGRHLMARNTII